MLETYFVSLGVAVSPIWVAEEKYSRISRQAESSAALPPVAFVDHDQVEEAARELAVDFLIVLRPGHCLVEAEIDLVGGIDTVGTAVALDGLGTRGQLGHRAAEGAEVVHHRLVDQDVAVRKEQDAFPVSRLPQPPDDLEGGVSLARAGGHDEQDAILSFGDGLDRGVDRVDLVVARGLVTAALVIVLKDNLLGFRGQALPGAIARPQFRGRRKRVESEIRLSRRARAGAVVEHEAVARSRRTRMECSASRRSRALAACRRRRYGNCPWPR